MKIDKVYSRYKHHLGFWVVLAKVKVNGRYEIRRLSADTEEEARSITEGTTINKHHKYGMSNK